MKGSLVLLYRPRFLNFGMASISRTDAELGSGTRQLYEMIETLHGPTTRTIGNRSTTRRYSVTRGFVSWGFTPGFRLSALSGRPIADTPIRRYADTLLHHRVRRSEIEDEDDDEIEDDLGEYHDDLLIPRIDPGWNAKRRREDRCVLHAPCSSVRTRTGDSALQG